MLAIWSSCLWLLANLACKNSGGAHLWGKIMLINCLAKRINAQEENQKKKGKDSWAYRCSIHDLTYLVWFLHIFLSSQLPALVHVQKHKLNYSVFPNIYIVFSCQWKCHLCNKPDGKSQFQWNEVTTLMNTSCCTLYVRMEQSAQVQYGWAPQFIGRL